MTESTTNTGVALKALRLSAALTIEAAAKGAGISPSYLSRVENGIANPSPNWISNYVGAVGDRLAGTTRVAA